MKNFYEVSNTIENGPRMDRVKSRISPMRPLLTMLALLMVCLFGVNENAWGAWTNGGGTITTTATLGGKSQYVVMAVDNETHTSYRALEAISRSDVRSRSDNSAPAGQLYIQMKYTTKTIVLAEQKVKVQTSEDNSNWENVSNKVTVSTSYTMYGPYNVSEKAKYVRIISTDGAKDKYFDKVYMTLASVVKQPSITSGSWTFTTADYAAEDSYKDFTVDWSNVTSLSLSKEKNGSSDDCSQFSYEIIDNTRTLQAGNYGTATIRVKYKHDKVGTHSVKINVGSYSITFTGTTNKITPNIDTTPTVDTITYGQTISNSQLHGGLVKADLINNTGATVAGTWTIDENDQIVTTSGGSNATVHLTFTPADQNTYNVIQTTQTMFVRSAATITWASAYSAEKPTIPVGKTIENAASTNANGATVTYSTPNTDIIAIENEGTTFRAIAEGEATITASHGVTATHGSASISKTFKTTYKDIQVIVWTDRFDRLTTEMTSKNLLAQVWIENPSTGVRTYSAARTALLEYSVEDNTVVSIPNNSTTLTIHKKGNTTITASVEGDDQYESASVTMEVKVREPSAGCDDPIILKEENNGSSDYLYRLFSDDTKKPALYTDEYAINVAQGRVPDKLSFGHKGAEYKVVGLSFWTYYSGTIKAQQKVNGQWIDVENSSVTPEKEKWNTKDGLQLDERATHIRFCRPQGGEGYHYVRNVEVTMKHFIRSTEENPVVDFGNTIKVNSSEFQDVVVKYSNVKDALQVVNPFTSDVTVSDEIIDIEECGAFGSDTLRIYFNPTTATEIDDYIVVKDPVVGNSSALSIRVKADVQRADQTITWNPATSISTIDQILLNGSTNGQEYGQMNVIGYEVTNNDGVISVTNNVVTILKPGTVTITASQPGTANYDVAEPVEKNFTISAEPLTLIAPTAQGITYGQALPTLIGGSAKDSKGNDVDGTFAWQNPDAVLNAGNNQTPNVVFTPSTNAAWYTNLTTTANINVTKADPAATVENVSFAYGTKAEEVALDGTGAGEWTWTGSRKDDVLAAGEYEMDVHFAPIDDANYNAIDTKITLTVNKANPAATVENVSFAYGTKAEDVALSGTGAGTWTWTDSRKDDVLTVGEYEMDVHFTPTDDANYNAIDTKITLTVTKANPVATVENVSFAYGTKAEDVALSGTGAGTWTWTDSRKDDVLAAGEYEMDVHFAPTDGDNYNAIDTKITLTVNKIETLQVPVVLSFCAGGSEEYRGVTYTEAGTYPVNATGANRDTVYNVIVTVLQPTTGTDSKTITYGENESWHGTDLSGCTAGEHEVEYHTTNAVGCDSTVTLSLTVNKATPTLSWETAPAELAYNATDVVYAATSTSNEGDITYSITSGSEYAEINANTGVLTIDEPGHQITIQASQAASTNYNAASPITVDVTIAAAPAAPTFTNATNNNDWQTAGNWSNGEVPSGENPNVIISGELIINEDVTVGGLTILPTGSVAVVTNGTLTIKGTSESRSEYGDMHVADDGNVVLGNSADLKVRHFFLDAKLGDSSTQAASGQVKGNGALNVIGDAYFQMKFDPSGAITYGWYDFVVPFEVNTSDGIYRVEANDDLTPMTSGVDFLVQSFSEARCAAGQKAWTNFSGTMMPGQGYTITFNYQPSFNQNTFLFKKKAGATIGGSNTYSAVRTFSGEESEQGWNVLGNGTLQHIELAENLKIQIFEHASNSYQPFVATEKTIAVGTSFQVQVFDAQKTIVMSTATDRPILAPKREVREVEEFRLSLTAEGEEKEADRLWISASEEATGAYWIGHDLLKKGTMTGAKVARMWCTRNGKQLCDVEMPMVNGSAENALGLFTPNAGQYTLAIEEAPADASLYLTYNGAVIWDLTASPYVFDLTKGTTEGYGLRIEAANAPQVTTGVENGGLMNDANSVRKVIIDNKMYIITPEGAIFDAIGKKVQ